VRDSLKELLEMLGFEVEAAADGPQGLAIARASSFDAILIDIGLPGMDGYEVCRELRRNPIEGCKLVALTGYGQPEDRARALAAGFDKHVAKPIDPSKIAALLSE
jgi:CheY-like chemotaxis protein